MKIPRLRKLLKARAVNFVEVESTALAQVGYIRDERCLVVQFVSGTVYAYHNVPPKEYTGMIQAWSHGEYFHDHIRDKFVYTKL